MNNQCILLFSLYRTLMKCMFFFLLLITWFYCYSQDSLNIDTAALVVRAHFNGHPLPAIKPYNSIVEIRPGIYAYSIKKDTILYYNVQYFELWVKNDSNEYSKGEGFGTKNGEFNPSIINYILSLNKIEAGNLYLKNIKIQVGSEYIYLGGP